MAKWKRSTAAYNLSAFHKVELVQWNGSLMRPLKKRKRGLPAKGFDRSIDWIFVEGVDGSVRSDRPSTAAGLDVYLSHHVNDGGRNALLSYGSLPQRSFTPSVVSNQYQTPLWHYGTKEMPGRSIALGSRCRTRQNRKCIRYSIPSAIPPTYTSVGHLSVFSMSPSHQ